MANYFQTGFTALQELAKMKKEHVVKETPKPVEGQQTLDQNGVLVVYSNGQWISEKEYSRIRVQRLGEIGDCV